MTTGSCHFCDAETTERFGGMWLCAECDPGEGDSDDGSPASAGCETPVRDGGDEPDDTPREPSADSAPDPSAREASLTFRALYEQAAEQADRETWEYVEESAVRDALDAAGFAHLLDSRALHGVDGWRFADPSGDDEPADPRWYYASGDEPRPDVFRRFDELLRAEAPDDYVPHYFRVAPAGKDPATQFGGWKRDEARLDVDEAVEWMEGGGNVGIAGRGECKICEGEGVVDREACDRCDGVGAHSGEACDRCDGSGDLDGPLVNVDIDDDEATTPDDVPTSLRARSRSRTGWHTWYFDPEGEIPNIPTDDYGEVRAAWQYVVAPGSFVASAREELPDDAADPGYYTVEAAEPVARIGFDDLPEVFQDAAEADDDEHDDQADGGDRGPSAVDDASDGTRADDSSDADHDGASAVFDVEATDLITGAHDPSDRFTSIFHDSDTGANMSVSNDKLHCWRHNVAHGGLQALATLSTDCPYGCGDLGASHKNGGAGSNRLKGKWQLVWYAWREAKSRGLIPDDDPVPWRALVGVALDDGVVDDDDIVEREGDGTGTYTGFPDAATYDQALDHVRETYDVDPGRDPVDTGGDTRTPTVETCAPPAVDRVDVDDITDRWRTIRARLDDLGDGPTIFADEAGSGKTTNTGIGLAERDDPHAILFDKHEKAREYVRDDATPCGHFHLKGGGQPRDDACLDAHHAGERCDDHGDTANCPRMCPVYDLDPDDPVRREYDRLVDEVGPVRAHQLFADELPDHDEDGACAWLNQFDAAARAERVVGVHEYQTLKTVTNPANGPTRQVVVDETPSVDGRERLLDVETLVRLSNALEPRRNVSAPDDDPTEHNHLHARAELAAFARRVVDALTDPDAPDDLADVDAPAFAPTTVEVEVDPDNLPVGIDPEDVRTDTRKRDVGMHGEGYETVRCHVAEVDLLAETLAHAKQAYEGAVLTRIRSDERDWNGEPLATDALLAAAAAAGVDARACRQAAAVAPELSGCPRCHEDLEPHDGRLVCPSCAWDEAEDYLVGRDGDAARCDAELHTGGGAGLHYRRLPHPSDLPDAPLVLDATATPEKVAALYGVDRDAVDVYGDDTLAVDQLRTTQVLDGQYHASTIRATDSVRERVERTVRKLADVHGDLLVVGKLSILDSLDLPTTRDGVDVLHYHAARGLNRAEYDAVVAVGAPHPDVDDLRRDAALLTQDRGDLRVGGVEHSTRRDCEQPPVYRKLDYADDGGDGRAVPTKHYTGLTGALFREGREKELEQVVHRIRPLLADDDQRAYLLTNVPTDLHVDEVCSFDELADPIEALLPVPEGALDLLRTVRDAAVGDLDADGVRAERLVETAGGERDGGGDVRFKIDALHRLARVGGIDVAEKTIRRWVDGLTDLGLLDAGEYEYRAGVPYTADPATLTSVLSVVSNNASVEVAARRRFRAILAEADGTLSWLDRARDVLGLRGGGDEVDPPPQSASPAD